MPHSQVVAAVAELRDAAARGSERLRRAQLSQVVRSQLYISRWAVRRKVCATQRSARLALLIMCGSGCSLSRPLLSMLRRPRSGSRNQQHAFAAPVRVRCSAPARRRKAVPADAIAQRRPTPLWCREQSSWMHHRKAVGQRRRAAISESTFPPRGSSVRFACEVDRVAKACVDAQYSRPNSLQRPCPASGTVRGGTLTEICIVIIRGFPTGFPGIPHFQSLRPPPTAKHSYLHADTESNNLWHADADAGFLIQWSVQRALFKKKLLRSSQAVVQDLDVRSPRVRTRRVQAVVQAG